MTIDLSPDDFRAKAIRAVDAMCRQLRDVRSGKARSPIGAAVRDRLLTQPLPIDGTEPDVLLQRVFEEVLAYPMGNGSPRFFGWINSPAAPLGVIGEFVAAAMNSSVAGGQPQAIRSFIEAESALIRELIPQGSRVIDFGCGMGRHLIALADHISLGVGIDYEAASIAEAARLAADTHHLRFVEADATAVPLTTDFDMAVCLTNTWGTMSDKSAVLEEMKRLSPKKGSRLITVYAPTSVSARSEWYANIGHKVLDATDERIVASGGFTSEHYSEDRRRGLLGPCELHMLGDIAYVAQC